MAEHHINQKLALEMTMQEVLGNLEELSLDFGYSDGENCFEILAIEAPDTPYTTEETHSRHHVRSPLIAEAIPLQKQRNVA